MLDFGAAAYFVSLPLLIGGVAFGIETATFVGAVLALTSIVVIASA